MPKTLEVIVTSVEDAIEAEAGGADRLELVRSLEVGGLTPPREMVEAVLAAVRIPVRVMLRQNARMTVESGQEMAALQDDAAFFARLPIHGMVAGFIRDGSVDTEAISALLAAAPDGRFTFHRAFDEIADTQAALTQLKSIPQIDRILTVGGDGEWPERKERLLLWQREAAPSIALLVGAGLNAAVLADLRLAPELHEVHVGRAARLGHSISGAVQRENVRALKSALA